MTLTAVSLFSGAGGLDLGVERAGFRTLLAAEMNPTAAATLSAAFPGLPVRVDRVEEVPWDLLRQPVDLVYGGPPCQPFSASGKGLGEADPRDGVPHFLAVVRRLRPRTVLLENVRGLTFAKHADYLGGTFGSETGVRAPRLQGSDHESTTGVRYRRLTWWECAALQGFPADWPWHGGATSRYQQIGNAVPPPLAEAVARAVMGALRTGSAQ